jgi:hypothetical protein
MTNKIDVCLSVYGKPYQTIITVKSLLRHSGDLIDKIYMILEPTQPEDFNIEFIKSEINYNNLIIFTPKYYLGYGRTDLHRFFNEEDYRLSVRYQYGIEKTDKKFLLTMHNDVLFKADVIKNFIDQIGDNAGIGQIGQCWNCPMFYEKKCDGDKFETFKPSYDEVLNDTLKYPSSRTFIFRGVIDRTNPMPLPECRLNEWCSLLNMETYKKETMPYGNVVPFGSHVKMDTSDEWFRQMFLKGYKFKNVDINEWCTHGYFSEINRGNPSMLDKNIYKRDENLAKEYFLNELNK